MELIMMLVLLSPAFENGDMIPVRYTADGEDISPPLEWEFTGEISSFALICIDPDAPRGDWIHWVVYNIPGDSFSLPEAVPAVDSLADGTLQGTNSWGNIGYGGPAPPSGKHSYIFVLYALDGMIDLEAGVTAEELIEVMEGRVVAQAELVGEYTRDI